MEGVRTASLMPKKQPAEAGIEEALADLANLQKSKAGAPAIDDDLHDGREEEIKEEEPEEALMKADVQATGATGETCCAGEESEPEDVEEVVHS